jgi:hypothetical protein
MRKKTLFKGSIALSTAAVLAAEFWAPQLEH